MEIDLDAIRRARLSAMRKKKNSVSFGGKKFPIAGETPWDLKFGLVTNDVHLIVSGLEQAFGKKWDEFRALRPSVDDIVSLAFAIDALDGPSGEVEASRVSSSSTSRRSRRTSNGSTS